MFTINGSAATTTAHTEDNKKLVREFFDRHEAWQGEIYRSNSDPHARGVRRRAAYICRMLRSLPCARTGKALDAGCGPGVYLQEMSRLGFTCYGMELSPVMLQACRNNVRNSPQSSVELFCGDIEQIPFERDTFELLLCIGVLQYLVSPIKAIEEINRVLKPGGFALISFENLISVSNLDWVVREKVRSIRRGGDRPPDEMEHRGLSLISQWFLHHPSTPHQYRLYHPRKFEALMEATGFSLTEGMTYGYEFRMARRLRLLPGRLLDAIELFLEEHFHHSRLRFLRYSGEYYIGVFQKLPLPDAHEDVCMTENMEPCAIA